VTETVFIVLFSYLLFDIISCNEMMTFERAENVFEAPSYRTKFSFHFLVINL
jgi:hypothetical protein